MPKIWEPGREEELLKRVEGLRPDTRAQWGGFTPSKMLWHCAQALDAGLGLYPLKPKSGPLRLWPINKFIIHIAPWPKGAPTAPELIPDSEPDFARAQTDFRAALRRFVEAGPDGKFVPHTAFGSISAGDWGALAYRHIDHHLRQFGL